MIGTLREKSFGSVRKPRRYDLPLNSDAGTGFLILLIALMSFLTVLALSASFALSAMTGRWTTGLENRVTVEIPATDEKGGALTREKVRDLAARIADQLQSHPSVTELHILSEKEIASLVEPWLGDNILDQNIPVPALISLRLGTIEDKTIQVLQNRIKAIHATARLDTHENWLKDLLRFTGALQFAALLLVVIIGVTMVTAVAGAIRSRMAVHRAEVEILHVMGAADSYIARQFQRHSLILAFKGALAGLACSGIALLVIGWLAGEMDVNLLPDFRLQPAQLAMLAALPLCVALLASVTAGRTVRRVLETLP